MEKLLIRNLTVNDAQDYLSFAQSIINEEVFSITHIDDFKYTVVEEKEWIESVLKNKNNICLIAEYQDKIIGNINILQYKEKKLAHVADLTINIDKKFRNMGIGKLMFDAAFLRVKENNNIKKITLQVFENNYRAIHLYELNGFKKEGLLINQIFINNNFLNLVLMGINVNYETF